LSFANLEPGIFICLPLDCVQLVACLKLLGVIFDDNFKFNTHIDFLIKHVVNVYICLNSYGARA